MSSRKLRLSIFRFNPQDPASRPHMQDFVLEETPKMTLFIALNELREKQDPSIQFDFVCRAAFCGSCGMLINSKPRLACRTLTAELPSKIILLPLPGFRLIGDLSVDTGSYFREMGQHIESWIHTSKVFDPQAVEERMANEQSQFIYELDRCIECGCCLSACATRLMREDFIGAAGLLRLGRFLADPRDQRGDAGAFNVVGTDDGIFGCIGLLACDDYCPKNLPLETQLAYIRRRMLRAGLKARG